MKMKKIGALIMACVMALSLAATAFATDATVTDPAKGASVKVTGSTLLPTIKLTVPTAAGVVLNPYGMKLKDDLTGLDSGGTISGKVVSAISNITNLSDVKIKVGVTATATATGLTLAKASVASITGKDKQAFVKLEMITADDANSDADAFGTPEGEIILATAATSLKTPIELAASTDGNSAAAGGVLAFRFTGDTSSEPTTAWTNKDTVTANLAFTFTPMDAA